MIETYSTRKTSWFREINKSTSSNQPRLKISTAAFNPVQMVKAHRGGVSEIFQSRTVAGTADKHTTKRNGKNRLNIVAEIFWRLLSLGRTK